MNRQLIKAVLATVGVTLAVVAIVFDNQRVMWGAIAALAGALMTRFLPVRTKDDRR